MLDRVRSFERGIGIFLERHLIAPAIPDVRRDQQLCLRVVDAIAQRIRREPAEDHRVDGADAGASQHRDRCLRNERQVDGDAVSFAHAEFLEHVGELLYFAVQIPVSQRSAVARLSFPDESYLIRALVRHVTIDAVRRDVELAADEPL